MNGNTWQKSKEKMGKMEQMEQMPLLVVMVRMAVQEVQEEGGEMEETEERQEMFTLLVQILFQLSTKLEERVDFWAKADEGDRVVKEVNQVREELEGLRVKEELLVSGQVKKDTSTANATMMSHVIVDIWEFIVMKIPPANTMGSSLLHIMVMFLAVRAKRVQMGLQEIRVCRVSLDRRDPRVLLVKMDKMA